MNMDAIIYAATRMTTTKLTDMELNALYLCLLLDVNPVGTMGYDKAVALYSADNGTKMHAATRSAFERIVAERVGL